MKRKSFTTACLIAVLALLVNFQLAFAHESITVGNYEMVYGWVNEPPIAGQLNGVEIFVNDTSGGTEQPVEEEVIQSLVVELTYGGESKTLTLEPVFDAPGAFDATVIPTIPGLYSLKFSGTLGDTPAEAEVELEEVQPADAVQFPGAAEPVQQNATAGVNNWLTWVAILLGLVGVGLGVTALQKIR